MDMISHPAFQALAAGLLSWLSVSLGAALIFTRRAFSRRAMDCLLGAAGGMMLGAAFLGLLRPALELAAPLGRLAFLPIAAGLLLGAAFLLCLDRVLPHIHMLQNTTEGLSTSWRRSILLVTAMALHHIPEGLAIGVGYGAAGAESMAAPGAGLSTALVLTLSIMLQNVPEGLVVSAALRSEGFSARKSCFYGVLSGVTAPLGAVPGALAAGSAAGLLPVALAFAAGAMIYVVVEEVTPEANASGNGNLATVSCIAGVCLVIMLSALAG
ncbi:ZIP family metal transporter [Desulfovibrio sp. SGI.169]|uniref:ZIP family metal transporter n=1 Tax=Desulfovibrio sp. SGI.169 TaxID=3420561 RepID=UPI003D06844D